MCPHLHLYRPDKPLQSSGKGLSCVNSTSFHSITYILASVTQLNPNPVLQNQQSLLPLPAFLQSRWLCLHLLPTISNSLGTDMKHSAQSPRIATIVSRQSVRPGLSSGSLSLCCVLASNSARQSKSTEPEHSAPAATEPFISTHWEKHLQCDETASR